MHSSGTVRQLIKCISSAYTTLCADPESVSFHTQVGFFNIVGLPLFKAMADVFEDSVALYEGALANFRNWEAAGADDALSTTASA